ncbi:MAG: hypothetical protein LBU32_10845 [Clostridiales bacterium]|nr:hypothetical protein [Clostridiales bacterium]
MFRDGHARHGRKNCKSPILNVRRMESRKMGGGAPNNPAALCGDCRSGRRGAAPNNPAALCGDCRSGRRGAAFMGIMRRAFYNRLKEKHPDAGTACGHAAKNTRIRSGLEKDHAVDARCMRQSEVHSIGCNLHAESSKKAQSPDP